METRNPGCSPSHGGTRKPVAGMAAKLAAECVATAKTLCGGVGQIAFLHDASAGALILLGLLIVTPAALLHGLLALSAARLLAALARLQADALQSGMHIFNPLLAGLAVGHFYGIGATSLLLAAGGGMIALVLTVGIAQFLHRFALLPPLSLPFVLVSWVLQLAAASMQTLVPAPPDSVIPAGLVEDGLAALGYIFFVPDSRFGMVVAFLIARYSPLLFVSSVTGLLSGALWMWLLGQGFQLSAAPGFNFALLGMAIGASFLIPSWRSLLLVVIVSLFALLLSLALRKVLGDLPGHALPYNLATLATLFALGICASPLLRRNLARSPEQALRDAAAAVRYPKAERTVGLPVGGEWTVLQGEDGPWTHQGQWRHACDFIICDADGDSHRNKGGEGRELGDYYAFGQPVLSPVNGVVAALRFDLPDCPIGQVDQCNSWGNYLIIYDERGFYVELSHLQQFSSLLHIGERVTRGMAVALVGSSGYSPQPHLHMQIQASAQIGAPTLPFCYVAFHEDGLFVPAGLPRMGARVAALQIDAALATAMTFHPGDKLVFSLAEQGQDARQDQEGVDSDGNGGQDGYRNCHDWQADQLVEIDIGLAADGSFRLRRGTSSLYVGRDEFRFLAYSLDGDDPVLRAMLIALPSMPFGPNAGQGWGDWIPAAMCEGRGFWRDLCALFVPRMALARYRAQWTGARSISASLTMGRRTIHSLVVIDEQGIAYLRVGALCLRRARLSSTASQPVGTETLEFA